MYKHKHKTDTLNLNYYTRIYLPTQAQLLKTILDLFRLDEIIVYYQDYQS